MKYLIILVFATFWQLSMAQGVGATSKSLPPANAPTTNSNIISSPKETAKNNALKIKQSLSLTEDQYKKIYQAFLEYEDNKSKLASSTLPQKNQFRKSAIYKQERQAKLKTILTPDQFKMYMLSFP